MTTVDIIVTVIAWFVPVLMLWTVAIAAIAIVGRAVVIAIVGRANIPTGTPLQDHLEPEPPPPLLRIYVPNTWGWQ